MKQTRLPDRVHQLKQIPYSQQREDQLPLSLTEEQDISPKLIRMLYLTIAVFILAITAVIGLQYFTDQAFSAKTFSAISGPPPIDWRLPASLPTSRQSAEESL